MEPFDINHSMEEITNYIIDSSNNAEQSEFPYSIKCDFILNEDATIEVMFEDGKKLSEFLPSNLKIIDTPNYNKPSMKKTLFENGEVQTMEVRVNYEWLKKGGSNEVAIFAHEIGHALAVEEEIAHYKKLNELYKIPPPSENWDNDTKSYVASFFLKRSSDTLDNEVQAWNYGKIIASLFGVEDAHYEDVMRPQIEGMFYAVYSTAYNAINHLFHGNPSFLNKETTYPVYNLPQQEEIQVTVEELLSIFKNLDENRYKRNVKETNHYMGH